MIVYIRHFMVTFRTSSISIAANTNADTSDAKIHLDVPNESANFNNVSYEYITEQAQVILQKSMLFKIVDFIIVPQREELGHEYLLPSEIHNRGRKVKPPTQVIAVASPGGVHMGSLAPSPHISAPMHA